MFHSPRRNSHHYFKPCRTDDHRLVSPRGRTWMFIRGVPPMTESRDKNPRAGLPARKQLAYLGQFLLGVFLTALFFQLRVSYSRANREDFESIAGVGSLVELPVHGVLAKGTVPEFAELFDAVV